MERSALLSPDRRYRYRLERWRAKEKGAVCWIMLNPSTADAEKDDPTIRRCIRFTDEFGYGALVVVNLFAYRATDPTDLLEEEDPVGPRNAANIRKASECCDRVIVAWGALKKPLRRFADEVFAPEARKAGIELWCLGKTKEGQPRHPLYLRSDALLVRWP